MKLKLYIILLFLIITFAFANKVWFDGVYINSKVEIKIDGNGTYWAGERSLIEAEKNLINYMLKNRIINQQEFPHEIFLFKDFSKNHYYEVWLKTPIKQCFKNMRPILTGLVIVLKNIKEINPYPTVCFENGEVLKKFNFIPPFFTKLSQATNSSIVGYNPLVIYAKEIKGGKVILNNKDLKLISNARKIFDFIKYNRIIFIISK